MAQKPFPPDAFGDFERVFESLFDDLLITRWRGPELHDEAVTDHGDRYEVRLTCAHVDPGTLEIEASERRLIVRGGSPGRFERRIDFRHPIDAEATTARFEDAFLKLVLPKKRPRKIAII